MKKRKRRRDMNPEENRREAEPGMQDTETKEDQPVTEAAEAETAPEKETVKAPEKLILKALPAPWTTRHRKPQRRGNARKRR